MTYANQATPTDLKRLLGKGRTPRRVVVKCIRIKRAPDGGAPEVRLGFSAPTRIRIVRQEVELADAARKAGAALTPQPGAVESAR